ncbi:MAG: indolepyruvate oxidoreductase subunit beta [Deltaproteobacteria bacterium]|nr:indolepyruvate oxidoreductase subunit beta [Deltaproteobacteria bacterium]
MENKVTNILLAGVGGQGLILASEVMGDAFVEGGFEVKKSEVHGMSQRGGSVTTHVRFGEKIHSPLIKEGEVDILVAFEELEALRYLHFLRPKPAVLLNRQRIHPPSVALGAEVYPPDAAEVLSSLAGRFISIPGRELALRAGDARALNAVLLGAFSSLFSLPEELWIGHLLRRFPAKAQSANLEAFRLGRSL